MDNLIFVRDEDIPHIDDDDDDDDDYAHSRYDTPKTSIIEETSFTEQPAVRLRQRQRLLHDYIGDLYRYLEADCGNMDLINPDLFQVEKSKSGAVGLSLFNGETWVSFTNKRTGKFLAESTFWNKFGGIERTKRILSIEGDLPDFDRLFTAAQKLQDQLPTDLEVENIPLQDLGNLAEQVHVATREAATNTDLDMREFEKL